MKIICLEEHTIDPGIAQATQQAQAVEAGYMADIGSRVQDMPDEQHDDRPHLVSLRTITSEAVDTGAGRLAQMDRHGIDVQILSYSNAPQLSSPEQGVSVTRAANDRLAAAVQAYPKRFRAFAVLPWQDPAAAAAELERT